MKSLTREQSKQINAMSISDKHKKLVRKIARFVNNKNEDLRNNHDNLNTQFDIDYCSYSLSIIRKDRPNDISIDVYFYPGKDGIGLEIGLGSKPDGANKWFIKHELLDLLDLIYGD